jgi:ethanolamine ammonia-lyase small subunit
MEQPKLTPVVSNPWQRLRQFTNARIALGRAGVSLPTVPLLEFQFAHARARDAVHLPFDRKALEQQLTQLGHTVIVLHSAAADRHIYLQRPDLGRRLDRESRSRLETRSAQHPAEYDVVFVIADGLSPLAVHEHAVPFLGVMMGKLIADGLRIAPVVLVEQGRVAVADEVGQVLRAGMVAILIGERPGLSSPDSLGIYFTYRPRVGATDADRNCISNIRPEGLSYELAAHKLHYLMTEARQRKLSGVSLKDEAEAPRQLASPASENFLLED